MRRSGRADRSDGTREAILTAAETLFAEHGIFAVSNRQVSDAAGQGNNAAVGYHFGTKADLIRAIVRRHNEAVERLCQQMIDGLGPDATLRDWVSVLVYPLARYLTELGEPSWYARFSAQLMPDPAHRDIAYAYYLRALAHYEQIADVQRDQRATQDGIGGHGRGQSHAVALGERHVLAVQHHQRQQKHQNVQRSRRRTPVSRLPLRERRPGRIRSSRR